VRGIDFGIVVRQLRDVNTATPQVPIDINGNAVALLADSRLARTGPLPATIDRLRGAFRLCLMPST
jgi:hypothetical protein